jgi:hypothetical protein
MVNVMCHGAAKLGRRWWMSCVTELLNWDGDGGCHVSWSCKLGQLHRAHLYG